eukprot:3524405-Rhodomonas_salina.1
MFRQYCARDARMIAAHGHHTLRSVPHFPGCGTSMRVVIFRIRVAPCAMAMCQRDWVLHSTIADWDLLRRFCLSLSWYLARYPGRLPQIESAGHLLARGLDSEINYRTPPEINYRMPPAQYRQDGSLCSISKSHARYHILSAGNTLFFFLFSSHFAVAPLISRPNTNFAFAIITQENGFSVLDFAAKGTCD